MDVTFADQSFIVSAKFGTIANYVDQEMNAYYDLIVENDNQIKARLEADRIETGDQTAYYDITLLAQLGTEINGVNTAVGKLAKTATIKEKVDAAKTAITTAKANLDTAYAKLLSDAKTNAEKGLDVLYAKGYGTTTDTLAGRVNMTDEDRASFLKSSKAAVEGCKSLQAISELIEKDTTIANNDSKTASYNVLESARGKVFTAIDTALTSVAGKDATFDAKGKSKEYLALVKDLEDTYGVKEEELPLSVAESYMAKASAATELPVVSKTDSTIALAKEAAKAISDAYDNIMTKVEASIIASYDVEIKAYSTDADWVTSAHSEVKNLVENWVKTPRVAAAADLDELYLNTVTVSNLVSYEGTGADATHEMGGLAYVETILANWNIPFTNYRLGKIKDSVKSDVAAYAADIVSKDSKYSSLLSSKTSNDIKGDTTSYTMNVTMLASKYEIPSTATTILAIKAELANEKAALDTAYASAIVKYINSYDTLNGITETADQEMAEYNKIASLITTTNGFTVNADGTLGNDLERFQKFYTDNIGDAGTDVTVATAKLLTTVDSYVSTLATHIKLVKELNAKYNEWKTKVDDSGFTATTFTEDIKTEKNNIFKDKVTSVADVDSFVAAFDVTYKEKVAKYLSDAKESLLEHYNYKINNISDLTQVNKFKTNYQAGLALIGTKGYPCDTFFAVNDWFANAKAGVISDDLPNSATDFNGIVAGTYADTTAQASYTVKKGTAAVGYAAVYDVKSVKTGLVATTDTDVTGLFPETDMVGSKLYTIAVQLPTTPAPGTDGWIKVNGKKVTSTGTYDGIHIQAIKEAGDTTIDYEVSAYGTTSVHYLINVSISTLA